jgi:hypothetical protein
MNWETFVFLGCLGLCAWIVRQPKVLALIEKTHGGPLRSHLAAKDKEYHSTFVCSKCENPDLDVCRLECPHYKG